MRQLASPADMEPGKLFTDVARARMKHRIVRIRSELDEVIASAWRSDVACGLLEKPLRYAGKIGIFMEKTIRHLS